MRRRTFFGTIGAAGAASAQTKSGNDVGEDYYDKLGVTKIINAAILREMRPSSCARRRTLGTRPSA